jgi:two-component system, NarL family, response regulator NreC
MNIMSEQIKILVVDDHVLIRTGVINLIKNEKDIFITGEADSGEDAVKLTDELKPDIILMDISMPGISGLEAAGHIKKKHPSIGIIILTIYKSEEYFIEANKIGVEGILHKDIGREELLSAIRKVKNGEKYIGQRFAQILADYYRKETTPAIKKVIFTRREEEILKLLAEGRSNHEIAEKLCISIRTVETHRSNLVQKLELKGTPALIKFAVQNYSEEKL